LLTFDATASDSEAPPQSLTFSLDAGAPSGASITPSGAFTWAPNEAQGPGVYPVTVRVTDNGSPVKSDFETISITVNDVNSAPLLNPIGNKIGNEGTLITFTAIADDTDEPSQALTYSLDAGAPATASINAAGVFTWTPTEANGPGSYPVTVRVTDNGTPAANDFETITITVNEANVAPVLDAIGNKAVTAGNLLTFTATASDTDQPAQSLTFSLDAGAPSGASITSGGTFTWTPTIGQAGANYTVTVRVSDNGPATLSDFETININVSDGRVRTTLVSFTNQWRYLATGTNLFTAWRASAFNDTAWPSAKGVFYNETTPTTVIPAPTNTFLPLTGFAGQRITNYYFRTRFFFPADPAGVTLTASNVLDDGAVIYINGAEAQRINMNPGAVLATTFSMSSWEANTTFVTNVAVGDLVTGENVLAVEVHQQSDTSTDVVFGLSLTASVPSPAPVVITGVSVSPLGVVTLQWASGPGNVYRLEYKTDLSGSTWLPLGSNLPSAGATTSTTDNVGNNLQRFYRVLLIN
jgi:hypothetical protein